MRISRRPARSGGSGVEDREGAGIFLTTASRRAVVCSIPRVVAIEARARGGRADEQRGRGGVRSLFLFLSPVFLFFVPPRTIIHPLPVSSQRAILGLCPSRQKGDACGNTPRPRERVPPAALAGGHTGTREKERERGEFPFSRTNVFYTCINRAVPRGRERERGTREEYALGERARYPERSIRWRFRCCLRYPATVRALRRADIPMKQSRGQLFVNE